jgi:hypothetical protein
MGSDPGKDDELVEKVARAIADILLEDAFEADAASEWRRVAHIARAALSVARVAIKEECARVADNEGGYCEDTGSAPLDFANAGRNEAARDIAAAIRAME